MPRPKGSKNAKPGATAPCPICLKEYKIQGMGTHLRERHHMVSKLTLKSSPAGDASGTSYNREDLLILKGKMYEALHQSANTSDRLRKLSYVDKTLLVKRDFEKRFSVRFEDLTKAHPDIFPSLGSTAEKTTDLEKCSAYANRKYSIE